ncbi:hypothetical protein RJT34_15550 [Clitoria ternatea]|uniref:Uncharacterized protein n=1 Tax=Clitoria ternatea TaxID=43366 RepID=A0AAN9PBJ2_CLITE
MGLFDLMCIVDIEILRVPRRRRLCPCEALNRKVVVWISRALWRKTTPPTTLLTHNIPSTTLCLCLTHTQTQSKVSQTHLLPIKACGSRMDA